MKAKKRPAQDLLFRRIKVTFSSRWIDVVCVISATLNRGALAGGSRVDAILVDVFRHGARHTALV